MNLQLFQMLIDWISKNYCVCSFQLIKGGYSRYYELVRKSDCEVFDEGSNNV